MYGWRGRIGLLVPSTNFTVEVEFQRAVPDGVSVHTARCMLRDVQDEKDKVAAIAEMSREVARASREVACIKPKVIAWACTAGSFVKGMGYDQGLIQEMETETGITSITTTTAVVNALKAMQIHRVAVATPYIREVYERQRVFLEESIPDLKVTRIGGVGILSSFEKGNLDPTSAYVAAREIDSSEAEAVFISCTAWRTFEIVDALEQDLGKPVITSNQATLWSCLKALGLSGIKGYGQLLDRH
ncbi:MAG: maleate cis-trans isomerase [Desulfobacterota bacterium]|nr:maleate cis-trans isomerase [Thermodesulfobacteriota bacterium]